MKIVAILEGNLSAGGGFNQALNAIMQMLRICENRFEFEVFTNRERDLDTLVQLGVKATLVRFTLRDRLLGLLSASAWGTVLQSRLRMTGPFERALLVRGCDLVYFLAPSFKARALQRLNYVATLWDLCHRDAPEFPEVRAFGEFQIRERLIGPTLAPAVAVLVDSSRLAEAAARRYGIDRDRFVPMPFAAAAFMRSASTAPVTAVLGKHGLQEGYLFYPAQLWPHKNHTRILQALALLRDAGDRPHVAFAGGDQGNRTHLQRLTENLGLREQVHFLGFVPEEDMRALYEACSAVLMPTYFGPTNIPPLEAWCAGKPLVYSALFREQVGDAALCVDPDDAGELAQAMRACGRPEVRASLKAAGDLRLREIEQQRASGETELLRRLQQFAARRTCWS